MKKVSVTIPQTGWQTIKTKYPSDDPINVKLDDLTGSSKNFDSTVRGSLTKRPGGQNYEQSDDADGPNKDQFEAIFTDGVHHLLKVVAGKLKYSSGDGLFTTVTTGYSTLGNFEFALFQDRVYFGNGIDAPQVYDRTTTYGGVVYTAPKTKVMGAQAPATAPLFAADTAGGNVPAGAHTYKVTYLYYDFEESNGGPASAVHTVVNPNNTVNLTSVPIGGYGVTARKIYRDNNDGAWLLVGSILDNTTTIFTDTAAVGTAAIPITNSVPPSFKYIVTNLDRTWIAGIPGDPSVLKFSEAGLPDIFPSANEILCNPEDPITALVVYDKKVWVFNRNSIGRILGNTRDTFQYVPLPGSVGCVDNRSIRVRTVQGVPTLIWLSDKGIWGTNGSSIEYLSDAIEDLVNLNIQQASQVKGQNAQTSQTQFQAGTASPGIDLVSSPGFITTVPTERVWDDETDWEGGSSLTNVCTNDGTNTIKAPTKYTPVVTDGALTGNAVFSGSNVTLPTTSDFTGESSPFSNDSGALGTNFPSPVQAKAGAVPIIPPRSGVLNTVQITVGVQNTGTWVFSVWDDLGGVPNNVLFTQGLGSPPNFTLVTYNFSPGISMVGGQKYYYGFRRTAGSGGIISPTGSVNHSGGHVLASHNTSGVWSNATILHQFSPFTTVDFPRWWSSYTFTSSAISSFGSWTSTPYDTFSDSISSGLSLTLSATYPLSTSSTVDIQGTNSLAGSPVWTTTHTLSSPAGINAVTGSGFRYWRIVANLSTTDNRRAPTLGSFVLRYNTNAIWISEAIDHTTDITTLDALTMVSSTPGSTSVAIAIATSPDDIIYSPFTSVGSATPQRYSKVRITLTSDATNTITPTVTSAELNWSLLSNLVSAGIDTGSTPAGWDIFQAQFTLNGGTVQFYIRSATTLGGLTAETFVLVGNGEFPTIPERQFVQWKVEIAASANAIPLVDSVTVNWFISQVSSIRVASLFHNRTYYLAAAEFNQTTNNLLIVLDGEGKWRIYRGVFINTLGLFFNDPYYGSSTVGRIIRFLTGTTDQGTPIEMVIESKSVDFGDLEHTKIGRKLYMKGKGTGAVYQVYMSFDDGATFVQMTDVDTGLTSFTSANDGRRFRRRFQVMFTIGQPTAGKTIKWKIVESTAAEAEIDEVKMEAWIRQGELVN